MNHGHALYLKAIELFLNKKDLPNFPQNTLKPQRLFLSKDWRIKEKVLSLYNYYRNYIKFV